MPGNHLGLAYKRHNLAEKLGQRYGLNGDPGDIVKAVDILGRAVKQMTQEHQHLPIHLSP